MFICTRVRGNNWWLLLQPWSIFWLPTDKRHTNTHMYTCKSSGLWYAGLHHLSAVIVTFASSVHKQKGTHCSISAMSNLQQAVCNWCCPALGWRKTVLYIPIEWLPTHAVLFCILSSQDEYFMGEEIQRETLWRILCRIPCLIFPVRGYVLIEKDYFALDVDISLFLSYIWELIGLFRSKKAIGLTM